MKVGRIFPLDVDGRQQGVVVVAVRDEDVFRARVVHHQAGVEQQVELGNDEGGVPGCARFAGEDVVREGLGEGPFEDVGAGGLGEGGGEG